MPAVSGPVGGGPATATGTPSGTRLRSQQVVSGLLDGGAAPAGA